MKIMKIQTTIIIIGHLVLFSVLSWILWGRVFQIEQAKRPQELRNIQKECELLNQQRTLAKLTLMESALYELSIKHRELMPILFSIQKQDSIFFHYIDSLIHSGATNIKPFYHLHFKDMGMPEAPPLKSLHELLDSAKIKPHLLPKGRW